MSDEKVIALAALFMAVLAVAALVWRGGRLEQLVISLEKRIDEMSEILAETDRKNSGLARMVYEMRGAFRGKVARNGDNDEG